VGSCEAIRLAVGPRLSRAERLPPRSGYRSAEGWSEGAAETTDLLPLPSLGVPKNGVPKKLKSHKSSKIQQTRMSSPKLLKTPIAKPINNSK
jgi:hypothetical protein